MKDNFIEVNSHHVNSLKFNDRQASYREHAGYNKFIFSIISLILFALIIASIFKKSFSGEDLSFTSFLNWLGDLDSFTINISISDFFIYGNWGILDGLRNFFNIFAQLFGVIVYMGSNAINLIIFAGQFIGFLLA